MSKGRALGMFLVALAVAWGGLTATLVTGAKPVLGLDLQGGFSIVLTSPEGTDREVLDKAVEIMRNRIESLGNVQEPEIAVSGDRSILVQLPGVTERERALSAVGTTGQLSFRQVFTIGSVPGVSPLMDQALAVQQAQQSTAEAEVEGGESGGGDEATTATTEAVAANPLDVIDLPEGVDPQTGITVVDDPAREGWLVEEETGLVYHVGPALVLGSDVAGATAGFQGVGGQGGSGGWVVDPDFTAEGSTKFEQATRDLAQFAPGDPRRRFAIVLDGVVVSAPQIAEGIGPDEGLSADLVQITIGLADNQQREAEDLATVLRYGALPTTFERDRVEQVSATLGEDSLRAGLVAGIAGLALVALAMVAYYRALGLITVFGLAVFGSIILMVFSLLGEFQGLTLTLAGVAGIVVSVGITSDSYIVYFERIKEEVRAGRTLRSAVDHAFSRAFRTILTADAVSLMGATLLWLLAIGPVKGFALALGMATVTDVVVAYFFTRPAAAWLVRTRLGDGGRLSMRGAVGRPVEAVS